VKAVLSEKTLREVDKSAVDRRWLTNLGCMLRFWWQYKLWPGRHDKWEGMRIGEWAWRQHAAFAAGSMPRWRAKVLSSVGFPLNAANTFEENALQVKELLKEYPECWPFLPKSRMAKKEYDRLQIWLQNVRERWQRGELSRAQVRLLKEAGIEKDPRKAKWDMRIRQLAEWVQETGRMPRPKGGNEEETLLAEWRYHKLRMARNGALEEKKVRAMKRLGLFHATN
jgi:hypothetical protein